MGLEVFGFSWFDVVEPCLDNVFLQFLEFSLKFSNVFTCCE